MQVKAIRQGYYDHKLRNPGEVFTLKPYEKKDNDGKVITVSAETLFSKNWMVKHDSKNQARSFGKKAAAAKAAHEPDVEESETSDDVI